MSAPVSNAARPAVRLLPPDGTAQPVSEPSSSSLLPQPTALSSDALTALLKLEVDDHLLNLKNALKDAATFHRLKDEQVRKFKEDLRRAMQAQKKGGFWHKLGKLCGTIGKIAAFAAAAAATVTTFGAGAPLLLTVAAVTLSSAALAQQQWHVLQSLGVSDKVAGWLEIGMGVGSAALTGGVALASTGARVSTLGTIARYTNLGAAGVNAGAQGVNGGATIAETQANGEAQDAMADATNDQLAESHLQQMLLEVVAAIEDNEKEYRRTVTNVRASLDTQSSTLTLAASRV